MLAGLLEVEPFVGDTEETLGIRHCDICYASLVDDVPGPVRAFYFDPAEQLSVCEHCTGAYLAESPDQRGRGEKE